MKTNFTELELLTALFDLSPSLPVLGPVPLWSPLLSDTVLPGSQADRTSPLVSLNSSPLLQGHPGVDMVPLQGHPVVDMVPLQGHPAVDMVPL